MEGRAPSGLMCVLAQYTDPAREAELNEWYRKVHIPEVTADGSFGHVTRWVSPHLLGETDGPKYLNLYETTRADVRAAMAEHQSHRSRWTTSPPAIVRPVAAVYKRTGKLPDPPKGRTANALLLALIDSKDPAQEGELIDWLEGIHVPELLETGLYWSAMRYENIAPGRGAPKYLGLYETELDGRAALEALLTKAFPMHEQLLVRYAGAFNLLYSQSAAEGRKPGKGEKGRATARERTVAATQAARGKEGEPAS